MKNILTLSQLLHFALDASALVVTGIFSLAYLLNKRSKLNYDLIVETNEQLSLLNQALQQRMEEFRQENEALRQLVAKLTERVRQLEALNESQSSGGGAPS